ncbi:MAG: glutamate--tRNA ligase [Bacilli bacterium]|nr:glutamate--tRNA ligase [Bacilli bacterium]
MSNIDDLIGKIFPQKLPTIAELEARFPARDLPNGALVTRFAPSPTGFLHTGSLFTALIAQKVAKQTGGIFMLRLEDTDTKREISGAGEKLLGEMAEFSVIPDEGFLGQAEKGHYGPYLQSQRADIYCAVIKYLLKIGRAYPCFATTEELEMMRSEQEAEHLIPGYYGRFAKYRDYPVEEALKLIKQGVPYVIRFKSYGNHENKIPAYDLIRGDLMLTENDQDVVILKGDGLPTYHFAHVVDDHFMRTTTVTRGEEWLSSLPLHLDLFAALKWKHPDYAHLPVINKLDNGNKRKLSKRKDPEAAVSFFLEDGYPPIALLTYLMSIANSNFEEWWALQPLAPLNDFEFTFTKMSLEGALFDIDKVRFFAKEIIAQQKAQQVARDANEFAKRYLPAYAKLIEKDFDYFVKIINIERDKPNPRKDYTTYRDIYQAMQFFYDECYYKMLADNPLPFNPQYDPTTIKNILLDISENLDFSLPEESWFSSLKEIAFRHKFAANLKTYKKEPDIYIGHTGDVAEMLRITLTTSKNSPNLFYVLQIIGRKRVQERIALVVEKYL